MSCTIRRWVAIGLVATVAACDMSPQEEFVVAEPEPITVEPTYTGKY